MCQVLGVSECGFSAWRKRPTCQRHQEDAQLTQEIRQVFVAHRGRYGSPRIHSEFKDQGRHIARKRVARLMHEAELIALRKRRRAQTPKRDAAHPVAPPVFNREFPAEEPNTKWVTESTSIPTTQGWLDLAVMLDWYARAVVGWSLSSCCDEKLAEHALPLAVSRRRPKAGFLHHSDRGCHYTSLAYRKRLEQVGAVVSMSRKGKCWDNAAMERFFGSLKEACVGETVYSSHEQARQALFEYLEIYSNRHRRHSTLGYVSPLVSEQMEDKQATNNV
jgi:transposase InsO family protein